MQTLDLNALDRDRHAVEKDGVKYVVQPMTPRILSVIASADENDGMARVRGLAEAVALILPDMPPEMIEDFALAQLMAVIRLSSTQTDAVEAYVQDPNVPRSAVVKEKIARPSSGKTKGDAGATSSAG